MNDVTMELLTTKQVSQILNTTPRTVRSLIKLQGLPVACIIGGDYRINENSLKSWMARTRGEE